MAILVARLCPPPPHSNTGISRLLHQALLAAPAIDALLGISPSFPGTCVPPPPRARVSVHVFPVSPFTVAVRRNVTSSIAILRPDERSESTGRPPPSLASPPVCDATCARMQRAWDAAQATRARRAWTAARRPCSSARKASWPSSRPIGSERPCRRLSSAWFSRSIRSRSPFVSTCRGPRPPAGTWASSSSAAPGRMPRQQR